MQNKLVDTLAQHVIEIISETNGITLSDTLELAISSEFSEEKPLVKKTLIEFKKLIAGYQQDEVDIQTLLGHPFSEAMKQFLKRFPIPYREEHIHLTGATKCFHFRNFGIVII